MWHLNNQKYTLFKLHLRQVYSNNRKQQSATTSSVKADCMYTVGQKIAPFLFLQ